MERLNDLRFVIGSFFAIVGVLLVLLSFTVSYEAASGKLLNLYSGLAMAAFGLFMLWLARKR